ncbi:P-loop containing nucleoside triphosphate hydrolase protein [Athelia psychrophila]|uniref:P-loop containing nucleoside triphosphate hydrolase protein n=1 Tax=Athelia psychrophila TaxID=1759441 RepID=A0A166WEB9_9AGAM|nr:P-loop containing nucleoside triphosphate hydrolase protein [Fibularhizoctonia sp. CBS 109695]
MTQTPETQKPPQNNVIIFGQTGAGKSSLVNMVLGEILAGTSSNAQSCTFESTPYEVEISGKKLTLWDTAGFEDAGDPVEPSGPNILGKKAIVSLYGLIEKLDQGISLLVFCVRGPRITKTVWENYKLFHSAFCQGKVPIVLVVTGLEEIDPMDGWWLDNKKQFHGRGMVFGGQACVTASKGKVNKTTGLGVYQDEFDDSREKVRRLLVEQYTEQPWKMEKIPWLVVTVSRGILAFANMLGVTTQGVARNLYQTLLDEGFSVEDAARLHVRAIFGGPLITVADSAVLTYRVLHISLNTRFFSNARSEALCDRSSHSCFNRQVLIPH